jgi:hypothetical protein
MEHFVICHGLQNQPIPSWLGRVRSKSVGAETSSANFVTSHFFSKEKSPESAESAKSLLSQGRVKAESADSWTENGEWTIFINGDEKLRKDL